MIATLSTPECLEDQDAIVRNIFELMVGINLRPTDPSLPLENAVASALFFQQAATGLILVECSPELAFRFTARFMSVPLPTSVDEDVIDSMGELANMIGGNLKGLMPVETDICMPTLLDPTQVAALTQTHTPLTQLAYTTQHGPCRITLFNTH